MDMRSVAQDDSSDSVYNTLYSVFPFYRQGVGRLGILIEFRDIQGVLLRSQCPVSPTIKGV
jgi:hypothetical protein